MCFGKISEMYTQIIAPCPIACDAINKNKKTGSVNLYKIDVTGFKELKIITPADASDPAWSPIIP